MLAVPPETRNSLPSFCPEHQFMTMAFCDLGSAKRSCKAKVNINWPVSTYALPILDWVPFVVKSRHAMTKTKATDDKPKTPPEFRQKI
ncbi:hypothetical protein SODG_006872 [Sodalis praecaptivus]